TADYTVWRDHLNQTTAGGYTLPNEGASTGTVDNADYTFWKNNFGAHGSGSGALGSGAVPEPSTLMMGLCGIVGILAARRKKFA
ncbi:MAG TPA: PEP-CTERM sorting domain-containing protein, partial [Lacipirellulaceae bacterium]